MWLWLKLFYFFPKGVCGDWAVNFDNQCALKGSSIILKCSYEYPFGHYVTSVSWSKALKESVKWELHPLETLPSPRDHFKYIGNKWGDCSLQVNRVQSTDEGAYFFSFETTFNRWRSKRYAYLYVRGNETNRIKKKKKKTHEVKWFWWRLIWFCLCIRAGCCCAAKHCDRRRNCQTDLLVRLSYTNSDRLVQRWTACFKSSLPGQKRRCWELLLCRPRTRDGQICLSDLECSLWVYQ